MNSSLSFSFTLHFLDQSSNAFKEVAIIRHPRIGEYAFGFITSSMVILQQSIGEEELCCIYVPSNHLYIGDIFLVSSKDILRPNLSVREGIGITFFLLPLSTTINPSMSIKRLLCLVLTCCRNCHLWGSFNTSNINGNGRTNNPNLKKLVRSLVFFFLGGHLD